MYIPQKYAGYLLGFLIIAAIGLVDSVYLSISYITETPLACGGALSGCNTVAASSYSKILGVPLAFLGVLFYLGMLFIATLLWGEVKFLSTRSNLVFLYTIFGALMSVYFLFVQVVLIEAVCIYCLVSALATWLLFYIAFLWRRDVMRDRA